MNSLHLKHMLLNMGPDSRLAHITFTPNGTNAPTVAESHGFSDTVGYSSAGVYTATLSMPGAKEIVTILTAVPGDANYHEYKYATVVSTGVITVSHRTVTYANIVSAGPAASNTSGAITLVCLVRVSS